MNDENDPTLSAAKKIVAETFARHKAETDAAVQRINDAFFRFQIEMESLAQFQEELRLFLTGGER